MIKKTYNCPQIKICGTNLRQGVKMKTWLKISLILIISICTAFAVACNKTVDDKESSDEIPVEWSDQWG